MKQKSRPEAGRNYYRNLLNNMLRLAKYIILKLQNFFCFVFQPKYIFFPDFFVYEKNRDNFIQDFLVPNSEVKILVPNNIYLHITPGLAPNVNRGALKNRKFQFYILPGFIYRPKLLFI